MPRPTGSRKQEFATTWWGRAWIDALEHRARLDPNRLPRGRTYARQNRVDDMAVAPGEVRASVWGSRARPYAVRIGVRRLTATEWTAVIAAIAGRAAHAAALLDGELDPGVVEDAASAGVSLMPDAGDVRPRCSCPDWADPCKHSAAVCYLVAGLLDEDPFRLFELRGRTRDELLPAVRSARAAIGGPAGAGRGASGPAGGDTAGGARGAAQGRSGPTGPGAGASRAGGGRPPDRGVPAAAAWRPARASHPAPGPVGHQPPLPSVPAPPASVGRPAAWPVDPPPTAPFDAAGLRTLARDAMVRAAALLLGDGSSGFELSAREDQARRVAAALATTGEGYIRPPRGAGGGQVLADAAAWRHAGSAGLRVIDEEAWRPPTATMVDARDALLATGIRPSVARVANNRIAIGVGLEVRLGRDGRWYRFRKTSGRWELDGPPADAADDLVAPPDDAGPPGEG